MDKVPWCAKVKVERKFDPEMLRLVMVTGTLL